MSSKQILIGAATVLLLLAFFIPNLVPIGSSSSSCQGTNCSQNSSSSTSYASLSVSQQTIDLNSSSKASVSFSLTDSVPLNLDIIGLNQFSAIASPNFANSSLSGVLTVSTTSAQPSPGTYPFSFEAVAAGAEILSTVSMDLVYSNSPIQNSTTTTTSSSSNSSLYFGLFSSYTVHLTRTLIGQGGSVISTTPLYSVFGTAPSTTAGFVNYTLSIQTTLGQGISPVGHFFIADFQTFGTLDISPDATPTILDSGTGWTAYDFSYSIPITGGSLSFLINATSLINGIYGAANAGVSNSSFGSQLSKDLMVSEALSPALSKQFVDTSLSLTNSNNVIATISKTSFPDFFALPSSTSSSTTTTTSIRCYPIFRCSFSVVPNALNISPSGVHQLSIFGFNAPSGTPSWAVVVSYALFFAAVLFLVIGIFVGWKD